MKTFNALYTTAMLDTEGMQLIACKVYRMTAGIQHTYCSWGQNEEWEQKGIWQRDAAAVMMKMTKEE